MFRVAHISDTHYMEKQPELADIIKCGNFIAAELYRLAHRPDLIVLAGDVTDYLASQSGIVFGLEAHTAAQKFVKDLAEIAPVVMPRGTKSHDGPGAVEALMEGAKGAAYPVYATERPEQICLMNNGSFLLYRPDIRENICALISILPSISKAF